MKKKKNDGVVLRVISNPDKEERKVFPIVALAFRDGNKMFEAHCISFPILVECVLRKYNIFINFEEKKGK